MKYRGVEQLVARRAHNPEVAGSSPVSATTKVLKSSDFRTFSPFLRRNNPVKKSGQRPDPSADPDGEMSGNYRTAPERIFPIVFAASFFAAVVTCVYVSSVKPAE